MREKSCEVGFSKSVVIITLSTVLETRSSLSRLPYHPASQAWDVMGRCNLSMAVTLLESEWVSIIFCWPISKPYLFSQKEASEQNCNFWLIRPDQSTGSCVFPIIPTPSKEDQSLRTGDIGRRYGENLHNRGKGHKLCRQTGCLSPSIRQKWRKVPTFEPGATRVCVGRDSITQVLTVVDCISKPGNCTLKAGVYMT